MEREVILQASSIGKSFHDPVEFKVLSDISFDVHRGEFVTLVGKSGSGKSTLLYILSTMDTDYEGSLQIHGDDVTGKKQDYLAALRNEKIGFVFQFHYLLPEFSCLKNVMIPALRLGKYSRKEIEDKAYRTLTLLGLQDQALKLSSSNSVLLLHAH
jgi:lipoprotein-releasing system ATP-binding protein